MRFRTDGLAGVLLATLTAGPPASDVAAAVEYLEPGEETNPATLERLRQIGIRFTLADAETKAFDITLSRLP